MLDLEDRSTITDVRGICDGVSIKWCGQNNDGSRYQSPLLR